MLSTPGLAALWVYVVVMMDLGGALATVSAVAVYYGWREGGWFEFITLRGKETRTRMQDL